jgi:hypothetical protein
MKTQSYTATNLDGFVETEYGSLHWLFPLGNINDTSYPACSAEVGALAMGSVTYERMQRHAQTVIAETRFTRPYTQPSLVFSSRTLPSIPRANLHFVNGMVQHVHSATRVVTYVER